jgi:threonine synthase
VSRDVVSPLVTLGEGGTSLVQSRAIGPRLGVPELWFKLEHLNPTGSFKDRFAAAEVSRLRAAGVSLCLATSSGNTGSALATYCARAGLGCAIFLTEQTPAGKLTQMLAHGATLHRVRGFGASAADSARAFAELARVAARPGAALVVSAYAYCPDAMDGLKTIAYELALQLPPAQPADVFVPIGGGGLCTAIARGFADLASAGRQPGQTRVHGVQPTGNDTVVTAWRRGERVARTAESATQISGLAVPTDIDATRALTSIRETGGSGVLVDDAEVWDAQRELARTEGLYVEPAGAASVAGLARAVQEGFRPAGPVVCLLTGAGFKDPLAAERLAAGATADLIDMADIERVVEQGLAGEGSSTAH